MECPTHTQGTRWKTYRHKETKEIWELIVQLQGLLFPGTASPGQRRIQIPVGRCWVKGSCQIFNHRKLRKKITDDHLRLPSPKFLGQGGPDVH